MADETKTLVTQLPAPALNPLSPGGKTSEYGALILAGIMALLDQVRLYMDAEAEPSLAGLGFTLAAGAFALGRSWIKSRAASAGVKVTDPYTGQSTLR